MKEWVRLAIAQCVIASSSIALAQDEDCDSATECCLPDCCPVTDNAIELSVIGIIPLIGFFIGAFPIRNKLMMEAAGKGQSIPAASMKGYAIGAIIMAMLLPAMLATFHSKCSMLMPNSWMPIVGILFVIAIILFVVAGSKK